MSMVTAYTEKRLEQWGAWARQHTSAGLGYPKRSIEGRLKEDGGVLPSTNTRGSLLAHEEAEEIERLVIELSQYFYEQAEVVKVEYLIYEPLNFKAKRLSMSRSTYITYRDLAMAWIDGRLRREKFTV